MKHCITLQLFGEDDTRKFKFMVQHLLIGFETQGSPDLRCFLQSACERPAAVKDTFLSELLTISFQFQYLLIAF